MAWIQFLDEDATESREVGIGAPFSIMIEGATSQTFKLYVRRDDGEYDNNNFINIKGTPYLVFSFDDTTYQLRASSSGSTAYWNATRTSQTDLTRGR